MKRILITGANSYIGMSFESFINQNGAGDYTVETVDMIDGSWKEKSFEDYDAVYHVAGIAHQKETEENAPLYYAVNRDLAIETAKKAKAEGVKHFVFLSSMSVYGMDTGIITKETLPDPKSHYGRSKLQAEEEIRKLDDEAFAVCVLRPPMVYGLNCKGNFQTVVKIVKKSPVFPRVRNQRSIIYIDNLSSFVKMAMDRRLRGVYFPQNNAYVNTADMAKAIALQLNRKRYFSILLGLGVLVMRPFVSLVKKAFGTLIYKDTEEFDYSYVVADNAESFAKSIDA